MDFPYGETITILTAGTVTNPYSLETTSTWTLSDDQEWTVEPSEVEVAGVGVEPRPSSEPVADARNAVISGFTLYLPADAEIGPHSRVAVRGGTYDVLGEPADWRNPFTGWTPGLVVQVGRTEG